MAGMSRQPRRRKPLQSDTPENEASITAISDSEQSPSSFTSPTFVQEPEPLSEESACSQTITSSPGTTTRGSTHDASLETVDSGSKRTPKTVTTVTTTTVEKAGPPTSQAISNPPRDHIQGPLKRRPSVHFESVPRAVTPTSTSASLGTRHFSVTARSSGTIENSLFEIQHLHHQENDHMLLILKARLEEHQQREQVYIERFELFQTEREELVQKLTASTTEITMLKIRLSFFEANQQGPAQSYDGLDSSVISTIATVTTQIEQWKDTVFGNKGNLTVEKTDLDQLSLSLSNASAQLTKLQRDYGEVSKEFISVRRRLEMTLSLCNEKDRTIQFIREEDAGKGQQIIALRRDNDSLRRDVSTLTAEMEERQNAAVTDQLVAVREELKKRAKVIEEKDQFIASLQDNVARSEATKAREITTLRQEYKTLERDSSEEIAELRKCCATLTKERDTARNELYESKTLVEGKDRTIARLKSEVARLKGDFDSTAQQPNAELQEKERLQNELAASASQISNLQECSSCAAHSKEIVSLREKFQIKETLLSKQEHVITSITAERDELKRKVVATEELLASARQKAEQLQQEVTAVRKEKADLEGRFEAQLIELNSLRDELNRLKIHLEGLGGGASGDHLEDIIRRALEEKEKEIEALRRKIAEATTQENELLKSRDELSANASALTNDLQVMTSRHEAAKGTINSLTIQVRRVKAYVTEKKEQLGTANNRVRELELEVNTLTVQRNELQGRFDAQSQKFITVRNEHSSLTSSIQEKDRLVASLTTERDQLAEQTTELKQESSVVNSRLTELQENHKKQSDEFLSVRHELDTCKVTIQDRDHDAVTFKDKIEELERTNTLNDKQIADQQQELTNSRSRINVLEHDHKTQSADLDSLREQVRAMNVDDNSIISSLKVQVEDWKKRHGTVGDNLKTARNTVEQLRLELDSASSRYSELERTLTVKIRDLQQSESSESRELCATREKFHDDLSISASKMTEYQEKHERETIEVKSQIKQWKKPSTANEQELATMREALEEHKRTLDASAQITKLDDNTIISSLQAQVENWLKKHGTVGDEVETARNTIKQLRLDIDVASSKYSELERTLTSQITRLQESESSKLKELSVSISSTRITEYQEKYERETKELKSQIEQWKSPSTTKEKEMAPTLEALKRKLDASSSQITKLSQDCRTHSAELRFLQGQILLVPEGSSTTEWEVTKKETLSEVQDYTDVIKLTSMVDEWVGADSTGSQVSALQPGERNEENEELRRRLRTLREIYIRAPRIKQIMQRETIEIKKRYEEDLKVLKVALADSQAQLRNIQCVVATADTYADETILTMLKKLNAEVQQNATYMAEHIAKDFQPAATKLTEKECKSVFESIGKALADGLASMEQDDAELYLSVAFQAFFSHYLRQAICLWTIEKGHNEFINEIYERLQKAETQQMSGRWRALTRSYIPPTRTRTSGSVAQQIATGLSYVVVAAGCASSTAAAKSKLLSFKEHMLSIITIAGQFSEMVWKTVSADFTVVAPSPRQTFDEAMMEEDDVDGESQEKESRAAGRTVLCSTQLGMTKRMQWESGSETLTMMKAKVVFESFLQQG